MSDQEAQNRDEQADNEAPLETSASGFPGGSPEGPPEGSPEPVSPEEATSDAATSDEATSDEATSDEATSDEATSDEATSDEATPDEATPDEATSDEATPDEPTSDEATPEDDDVVPPKVPTKKAAAAKKAKPVFTPPPPDRLEGAIEAVLLVAGDVVRLERLRDLLGLPSMAPLREALDAIRGRWESAGLAFELEQVGGGVRVVTRPEYAEYVGRLVRRPVSDKLSRTQLETLCIVAYKQPVGRAEVERIRGVQAGDGLRQLLERRLLKVVGRSDQPGRPLLYGTTQQFLTAFGLDDLKDLPAPGDLKRL